MEIQEENRFRRWRGAILGLGLGLIYGLASQYVNTLLLPGIPLYQPPFGAALNVLLYTGLGLLLGGVAGWPESTAVGVVWGAILTSVAVEVTSYFTGDLDKNSAAAKFVLLLFLFLPVMGAAVPFLYLLRKAIDQMIETYKNKRSFLRAAPMVALLTAGMLALASINIIPADGRVVLPQMQAVLQGALRAGSTAALPAYLQPPDVKDFMQHTGASYQLEWTKTNLTRYMIPAPAVHSDQHSVAVAHFSDGWVLACLYVQPTQPTSECRVFIDYSKLGQE